MIYIFKMSPYLNIYINYDLFPKNDKEYLIAYAYFGGVYGWNLL